MIPKLQIPYKCPVFLSLTDSKGESIAEGKLAHSFNSDLRDIHDLASMPESCKLQQF